MAWDFAAGTARYHLEDYAVPDWLSFANSVAGGASFPGVATFDLKWGPARRRYKIDSPAQGWQGDVVETDGSIAWHATTPALDFSFASASSARQFQAFAREQNGVFRGKPSAFFGQGQSPSAASAGRPGGLPNTGASDLKLGLGLAAGAAMAAAFLRRRERLMAEARSG